MCVLNSRCAVPGAASWCFGGLSRKTERTRAIRECAAGITAGCAACAGLPAVTHHLQVLHLVEQVVVGQHHSLRWASTNNSCWAHVSCQNAGPIEPDLPLPVARKHLRQDGRSCLPWDCRRCLR